MPKVFYCCVLFFVAFMVGSSDIDVTTAKSSELIDSLEFCMPSAECVLPIECPIHVKKGDMQRCQKNGRSGICCKTGRNFTEYQFGVGKSRKRLDPLALSFLRSHSHLEMMNRRAKSAALVWRNHSFLKQGSPSYTHHRNSRIFMQEEMVQISNIANSAMEMVLATELLKERENMPREEIEWETITDDLRVTPLGRMCPPRPECIHLKTMYRQIDGRCNNLERPDTGMSFTPFTRLLPASYSDGIYSQRVSEVNGKPLPSPRILSLVLFQDEDRPNYEYTLMTMQFGQFLAHDFTHSIDTKAENGSPISCCSEDGTEEIPIEMRHPACMPIPIPENDPFYGYFKHRCMNFVRSVIAPRRDCTLGFTQQMNRVTHFLDGSAIYGSSPAETAKLRSHQGGRLKVFHDYGRDLLPLSDDPDACIRSEEDFACFTSGDSRTNQMIALVAIHLLFLREHNRIADELSTLNPRWDDEKLFLEARRIVIAELQVITYKEFLPAILGPSAMEEFGLNLETGDNYYYGYDYRIDPSIANEFAAGAFRFGHSTVEGYIKTYSMKRMHEMIDLPDIMFNPGKMRKVEFFDQILSTLTTEPMQDVDNSIVEALTRYMFRGGNPFGVDLASINIQRGRDHGLRPYNDYRQLVGLPRISKFEDFGPVFGKKLRDVYACVNDIDLFVGGLLEPKYPGSILGPTFKEIIADQFCRLKKGDRYFFENEPSVNPEHFSREQLRELRKASMSRLVCDNSDRVYLRNQARNAFKKPDVPGNEFADCSGPIIPRVNLLYWREN